MDEKELHKKLDRIGLDVNEVKITQAVHTAQMEEHMRRTHLLETRQEQFEQKMGHELQTVSERIKPISAHIQSLKGVEKFLALTAMLIGAAAAVAKIAGLW